VVQEELSTPRVRSNFVEEPREFAFKVNPVALKATASQRIVELSAPITRA
jgi:hypothetical protein